MIRNVGLFITEYNDGENLTKVRAHLAEFGLFPYVDEKALMQCQKEETFAFTDNRAVADRLLNAGFGYAVYDHVKSIAGTFPEALYIVDQISSLDQTLIEHMLLRHLRLPWTIAKTTRCLIREITEADVDALYEIYLENAKAFQYTEGLFEDPADERAYTRDYIDHQYRFMEYGIWIVEDLATGKVIGRAGLSNREGYEDAELGYAFAIGYRHKGYATEVCYEILRYARDALGMERLNAFTIRENTDSIRLLKRLGFQFVKPAPLGDVMHDLYRIIL